MRKIILSLLFGASLFAQKPVPELPRVFIDTTYSLPTGGTTWAAHDVAGFKAALTGSAPGDVIVLDEGVTYGGNFLLPAKTNPTHKWIYIISSGLASLPAAAACTTPWNPGAGTCVNATYAPHMPKLQTLVNTSTITVDNGANYWRLVGLEITANSNYPAGCGTVSNNCVSSYGIFANINNGKPRADHVYVDRCYVHGTDTQAFAGGVYLGWEYGAVVDSYLSNIHRKSADTNGIGTSSSLGPLKIFGNFIEASTENIIFGGGGGNANPGVPSDIQIENNYIFKRLSWVYESTVTHNLAVKNAFEDKCGQRILFNNNVIENVWVGSQSGNAFLLTVRTGQSGNSCVADDITITNNVLKNVVSGFNFQAQDNNCGPGSIYPSCTNAGETSRVLVRNNYVTHFATTGNGSGPSDFLKYSPGLDIPAGGSPPHIGQIKNTLVDHNTDISYDRTGPCANGLIIGPAASYQEPISGHHSENLWFINNVVCGQFAFGGKKLVDTVDWPTTSPNALADRMAGNVFMRPPPAAGLPASNAVVSTIGFDSQGVLTSLDWSAHTTDGLQAGYSPTGIVTALAYSSPTSLAAGTQNVAYPPVTVTATGGTQPYAFSLQSGAWPTGISLDASTGVISGTPTVSGTFSPNIKVTDALAAFVTSGVLTLTINPATGTLTVTNLTFPNGTVGIAYTGGALTATGGVQPYTWDLNPGSGPLPTGLSIVGSAIVGTPTTAGTFTFTPRVTDSAATTAIPPNPLAITILPGSSHVLGVGSNIGVGGKVAIK